MSELEKETLLVFPCQFPIKMMGRECDDFQSTAIALVEKHVGTVFADNVKSAPSSKGNYLSITITINAQSQQQLDSIYRDLSDHEAILVAL